MYFAGTYFQFFSLEIKAFLSDFQPLWELGTFLD